MFAECLRLLFRILVSPRRLLVAALLASFFYAALVATKARLFPESALASRPTARSGGQASVPLQRHGGMAAKRGAHAE